jgi:hypothetical protein
VYRAEREFARPHNLMAHRYSNLLITELVIRENGVARRQAVILILCGAAAGKAPGVKLMPLALFSPRTPTLWRSACTILSLSLFLGGCRCIKMTNARHFVKTPPLHLIAFKIIEFSVSPSRCCTRHLRCAPGLRWFCRAVIFCPRDINKEKDLA